ncbi:MAG: hypothetical protein GY833_22320 [Aestuariibacter sp.]|nr:hypothetical protein [Aestuariibacter sp.]|tara:strand:+ start:7748 stop:8053 length:306 start_codon:yes stop_codon:yes gene_type:complete
MLSNNIAQQFYGSGGGDGQSLKTVQLKHTVSDDDSAEIQIPLGGLLQKDAGVVATLNGLRMTPVKDYALPVLQGSVTFVTKLPRTDLTAGDEIVIDAILTA